MSNKDFILTNMRLSRNNSSHMRHALQPRSHRQIQSVENRITETKIGKHDPIDIRMLTSALGKPKKWARLARSRGHLRCVDLSNERSK